MTTSSSSSTTKMSLKLLVDKKAERVLFAEASKDFIDFLFNLHRLPIGVVTKLLTKNNMVGSLGKVYESIENLSNTYLLHQNQNKDILLKPKTPIPPGFLLLSNYDTNINEEEIEPPQLYMCSNWCRYYVTLVPNTPCSNCGRGMNNSVTYVGKNKMEVKGYDGGGGEGGFVKEAVTYMVMDDLMVQPMSSISCISLLNKFNIKDVSSVQEMDVEFGVHEGIELLKASLLCNNVLTSVFHSNIKIKKE
ncbi:hypothetical protein QN277_000997 [Acacia crassicarpa]|uniref:DUF674 domain-containing protein n=1 Tax=Acacia crassicarpa TaxID=499986 RepID=A0AAE1N7P2_9FABA|nr:hypothetical protein QN277_000997 [Acacia crassicarpa]